MTDRALLAAYDERFRDDPDPWGFETSPYELAKRAATITACGAVRRRRALELGAANGVLAAELATFAPSVVAVEGVRAAADLARQRLAPFPGAAVAEGLIPDAVPAGPYDLIVASEILYYLDEASYRRTLQCLRTWIEPGGRLVAVHWRPVSAERPRSADDVHRDLRALPRFSVVDDRCTDDYLLTTLDADA